MGLFDKSSAYEKRVEDMLEVLGKSGNIDEYQFGQMVLNDLKNEGEQVIWPKELYFRCVISIYDNPQISAESYVKIMKYGKNVYTMIFPEAQDTPDYERLSGIFVSMFSANGAITGHSFELAIFNMFSNRDNYLKWMQEISSDPRYTRAAVYCRNYGAEARGFFTNEETFTANFIYVCKKILSASDSEKVYREQVRDIEHMAGIYDVDEVMLMEAEQQIATAKDIISRSKDTLTTMEKRIKTLDSLTSHSIERVTEICESEVALAESKINDIDTRLRNAYDKFLDTQRERILVDKNQLVEEVTAEAGEKLAEFRQNVQNIINMAKLEISKLNVESGKVMSRLDGYLKDDERLKELLSLGDEKNRLMKKLDRLTILNDNNIEMMENWVAGEAAAVQAGPAGQKASVKPAAAPVVIPVAEGCELSGSADPDTEVIPEVNPLLDEKIGFRERFNIVMKAKAEMEKKGEHFHKMFDDVLIAVMENANPYLIGPSGCGKTYMVGQIAKLLGTSFIDIGYINEEYDILGFQTANGGYSRPNFYRCYKYGKIAFCDELDNGNSRATVKLNSFLSNVDDAGYNFPNGEHVKRHGSFRIIAAGNTSGNGADSVYNTREKIEESVQQRFTPIYVGYDNEVERAILDNNDDWFEFLVLFREATTEWSQKSHSAAPGIVTTRDAARIKKYIDHGSFNMDKILDYEFIQTKDESYLAYLADYIRKKIRPGTSGAIIANCFVKKVDALRNGSVSRNV